MKQVLPALFAAICLLTACNKPAAPSHAVPSSASLPPDPVVEKLQQYSGASATNCGRLDVKATADQFKTTSDCAMQSSQGKKPFYVSYSMPGMIVGVAGNADGKLFAVQAQGEGPSAGTTAGDCPSQLRVASSGRITCFAPGDMGSMSGSHSGGSAPAGMANPHDASAAKPAGHP